MTFKETLEAHLTAIKDRNLDALIETLAPSQLTLVTANGELLETTDEFVGLHKEWFESSTWSLDSEVVHEHEGSDVGVAVILLDYQDVGEDGGAIRQHSYLTLIFAKQNDKWLLVQDQNTPIKQADQNV